MHFEKQIDPQNQELGLETDLAMLVKEFLFVQKRRIAVQLRIIAKSKFTLQKLTEDGNKEADKLYQELLEMIKKKRSLNKIITLVKSAVQKAGAWDNDVEKLYYQYSNIEKKILTPVLKTNVESRDVWNNWLKKVKGIDLLLAAEVLGGFEWALKPEETLATHFQKVSQMWSFAGLAPINGKAMKLIKGSKILFCKELKSILVGRLGISFLRQLPDKSGYRQLYDEFKQKEERKLKAQNVKIVPSSMLPKNIYGKHYEPDGIISQAHVHRRAIRKMIKVFVAHLFEELRKAEGLEAGKPYVIEKMGHPHYIAPIIN